LTETIFIASKSLNNSEVAFFGALEYSALIVTIYFCKNANLTIQVREKTLIRKIANLRFKHENLSKKG
jgi:hypothetical protein